MNLQTGAPREHGGALVFRERVTYDHLDEGKGAGKFMTV
jgi:hypothetical protein